VITRLWRGWTATENADAYEQFLLSELFPSMRRIPGFRGADVLRRLESDETAFVTLTRFDSLDDIREFAGEDYEVPVLEPQALALLSHYDERALHFDTASFSAKPERAADQSARRGTVPDAGQADGSSC
jgi:hypothetical protein